MSTSAVTHLADEHRALFRKLILGSAALLAGVAVYMLDRAPGSAYFLPAAVSFGDGGSPWFGDFGGQLPDFLHVYALSLLTAAVLGSTRSAALASCAGWWAIDSFFELGQHPAISPIFAAVTPAWFDGIPFLENTAAYFVRGTFDPRDLLAIAFGAMTAFFSIAAINYRSTKGGPPSC